MASTSIDSGKLSGLNPAAGVISGTAVTFIVIQMIYDQKLLF